MICIFASEQVKRKILINIWLVGSHGDNCIGIAQHLIEANYDVYILTAANSDYLNEINKIGAKPLIDYSLTQEIYDQFQETFNRNEVNGLIILQAGKIPISSVYNNDTLLQEIWDHKFEMYITHMNPDAHIIANILKIPIYVKVIDMQPEASIMTALGGVNFHSSINNFIRPQAFGLETFSHPIDMAENFRVRLLNTATQMLFYCLINFPAKYYWSTDIPDKYKEDFYSMREANMSIYFGVEGMFEPMSLPQNTKIIYPKYRYVRKSHSFGTSMNPTNETLQEIIEFMGQLKDFGILMALKSKYFEPIVFDKIKQLQNVYHGDFLPQREILKNDKLKIFYSHGGVHSLMESIDNRKPMIIGPLLADDQFFYCEMAHKKQFGVCLNQQTSKKMKEAVDIIEKNNYFYDNFSKIQKVIQKKKSEPLDLKYWVDYVFEVGTEHLQPSQYNRFNFFQTFDLDVYAVIIGSVAFFLSFIVWLIYRVVKGVCLNTKQSNRQQTLDRYKMKLK
eukprot:403346192